MPSQLQGARVTVMGLGRFGGGLGVTRFLLDRGAEVLLTDAATREQLQAPLAALRNELEGGRLRLHLGGHEPRHFEETDLVVVGPAVPRPWDNPFLAAARTRGVPITTEIRLAIEHLSGRRFIGVTGSVGKSSTAAMTHAALAAAGVPTALGGNIGGSLLDRLHEIPADAWVVLELSSFMLHWIAEAPTPWAPQIAVLTTLAPNHLDWHGALDHYLQSKRAIVGGPDPLLITRFPQLHPEAAIAAASAGGDWWSDPAQRGRPFIEAIDPGRIDLRVPGSHQRDNAHLALAAVLATRALSPRSEARANAVLPDPHALLRAFNGLPDRLEVLESPADLRWVNDSKSTTPEATLLAIEALGDPSRLHLIVGGADKGADLSTLAAAAGRLGGVYAIGAVASHLARHPRVTLSGTLQQAVRDAAQRMRSGDTLLLSPGCASWDQFANYRERADAFIETCREAWTARTPHPQASSRSTSAARATTQS